MQFETCGEGKWNGAFYAPLGEGGQGKSRPELVTGAFTDHFSNGSAVGAYVAKEQ